MSTPTEAPPLTIRAARLAGDDPDLYAQHVVEHLAKGLDEPLWGRLWLLTSERRVVGHLELRGGRVPAEMHRATLGMGILSAYTGRGHGRRLVEAALCWARDEAGL